jgi:hypothetical protein
VSKHKKQSLEILPEIASLEPKLLDAPTCEKFSFSINDAIETDINSWMEKEDEQEKSINPIEIDDIIFEFLACKKVETQESLVVKLKNQDKVLINLLKFEEFKQTFDDVVAHLNENEPKTKSLFNLRKIWNSEDDNFEEKRFLRKNEATLIARYFINKGFDVSSLEPDLSFKVSRGFARYFIRPINVREIYKKNKQGNIVVNKAYFSDLLRQSHNLLFYYIDIDERLAFERAISIYVRENIGSWRDFDEEGYAYSVFNHEVIQPVFDFPHTIPEESRIYPLPEKLEKMMRK